MDSAAAHSLVSMAVGGFVGTICRFLVNSGVTGVAASIAAAVISLLVVAVAAMDASDFVRGNYMKYLLMWGEVLGLAAGAFHGATLVQNKIEQNRSGG